MKNTRSEKKKRVFDSFQIEDCIKITLQNGGVLEIVLSVNEVKVYKIKYFLNGILLKPENWPGRHKAYKRWTELKCSLIENSQDFKELTPEESI